jgi:pimeloyl-ACP methyl ester carboxylesterase
MLGSGQHFGGLVRQSSLGLVRGSKKTLTGAFRMSRVAVALMLGCVAACTVPGRAEQRVAAESYLIPSSDVGIQLYIRNKRPVGTTDFGPARTVIYVNGTTQASETTFDLPLEGQSWMDYLAQHGYDVYLMDLRGYGGSSRPVEMSQPAADNAPVVRTETALRDLTTAIDHVLARRRLRSLDVIGWSWGATLAGAYAALHPDKVNRLVLYAPQWVRQGGTVGGPGPLGAYQTWTVQQGRDRLQAGTPTDRKDEMFPPAWFEQWAAAALATDPVGARMDPPVVRTPNGSLQDIRDYWFSGKAVWDPSLVKPPVLVTRGEWDEVTTQADTLGVFHALTHAAAKRLVVIGEGSHMVFIEKNRLQLFREVQSFLDEPAAQQPAAR